MRRKIAGGSDAAAQEATKLAERKSDLTSQSPSVASHLRWPVPTSSAEQKNEKERCREVRFAHERREREKN